MVKFPPIKINLGLNVKFKRTDGFHELESVMYQLPWCDILEIIKSDSFSFESSGLKINGNDDTNLCVKAYQLMKNEFNISPVKIYLHKIIPMGAGLGGGSSDGAMTLKMLNELFELNLSSEKLKMFAVQLGSDCALFIDEFPQLAKGRGEVLSKSDVNLKNYFVQLINIGIHVSTKTAFENLILNEQTKTFENLSVKNIYDWKNTLINDFESSVFPLFPELEKIKNLLYQNKAIFASMTGSGSTIYGIFKEKPELLNYSKSEKYIEKIIEL